MWTEPEWLMVGLGDGRIRRVDTATGEAGFVEAHHDGPVRALVLVPGPRAPDDLRLLSGGDDGRVQAQRWNGEVEVLEGPSRSHVTALGVSDDGARAAWAHDEGTVVLYGLEHHRTIVRQAIGLAHAVSFSPKGRLLAVGREDKRVTLLDGETGREVGVLSESDGPVSALAWSPDGESLLVGDASGALRLWDIGLQRLVHGWRDTSERVGVVAVNGAGTLVAAGSDDGSISVYDLRSKTRLAWLPTDSGDVQTVHFTPDEVLMAVGTDGAPHRWPVAWLKPAPRP